MKKIVMGFAAAVAITASSAIAQEVAVGLTGGTLGLGLEGTTKVMENVNVRLLATGYNYSKTGSQGTDIDYDMNAKLRSAGALVDFYPFTTVLRLTAGAIYNGTKVDVTGTPNATGSYTINGTTYTAAQVGTVTGEIKYQKVMPYLGFGFSNPMAGSNWTVGADFGGLIGKPTASLIASNPTNNATLAANVAAEEAKLQNDANKLTFYPLISMSISYRF